MPSLPHDALHRAKKTPRRDERATLPAGWDYNPSSWRERWPSVAFATLAFAATLHLAQHELDPQLVPWEPFFGDGTRRLLDSLLGALNVPFAALSAAFFLLSALTGTLGGSCRWRTLPCVVMLFAVSVIPLALANVALVVVQSTLLGAWSTLGLLSALLSVSMVGPALEEVLATLQHLQRTARCGCSWRRAFWGLPVRMRRLELLLEY